MRTSGDKFNGGRGKDKPYLDSLFQPNEERWSDRVLYALQSMLGIDIPDSKRGVVLTKSRAFGEASDLPVSLSQPANPWTLIGTLKAFAPLLLEYQVKLAGILVDTTAILADTTAIKSTAVDIDTKLADLNNTVADIGATVTNIEAQLTLMQATISSLDAGMTGLITEVQDVDIGITTLNTTATSIRTRMDSPFTTI
jgi:flagellin-like hook-associated protein FlgL